MEEEETKKTTRDELLEVVQHEQWLKQQIHDYENARVRRPQEEEFLKYTNNLSQEELGNLEDELYQTLIHLQEETFLHSTKKASDLLLIERIQEHKFILEKLFPQIIPTDGSNEIESENKRLVKEAERLRRAMRNRDLQISEFLKIHSRIKQSREEFHEITQQNIALRRSNRGLVERIFNLTRMQEQEQSESEHEGNLKDEIAVLKVRSVLLRNVLEVYSLNMPERFSLPIISFSNLNVRD